MHWKMAQKYLSELLVQRPHALPFDGVRSFVCGWIFTQKHMHVSVRHCFSAQMPHWISFQAFIFVFQQFHELFQRNIFLVQLFHALDLGKNSFHSTFFLGPDSVLSSLCEQKFHRLCDRSLKFMPYLLLVWHKATHRKKYQEFIVRSRFLIIRQKWRTIERNY